MWLRLYVEVLDDPKVQRLNAETFKFWINLLCLAKRHDGDLPTPEDMSFALRKPPSEIKRMLDSLIEKSLLDMSSDGCRPHGWNARQYKSDVSTERVRSFRKRQGNVSETPSETEADTEQNRTEGEARKRAQRLPEDWQASMELLKFASDLGLDGIETCANFKDYWDGEGSAKARKLDWGAAFRVWCRREAKSPSRRPQARSFAQQATDRAANVVNHDDLSQWRARCKGWTPGKFWMDGDWGPEPGQPGCRVPAIVLAEIGQ